MTKLEIIFMLEIKCFKKCFNAHLNRSQFCSCLFCTVMSKQLALL